MSKFIPTLPQVVKGLLITMLSLFLIKMMPAQIKAKIMG